MLNRRFHLYGLFVVLLALVAQLGAGASMPRMDRVVAAEALGRADDAGSTPAHAPSHPADCPVCLLCATQHAQAATALTQSLALTPPAGLTARSIELPSPSTARPASYRLSSQPRAPPTNS